MFFKLRRRLREGRDAWRNGDLDRAVERLEEYLAGRPGSLDAVFPLARALAERGETERALSLLEPPLSAAKASPSAAAARLFRALILFDADGGRLGRARPDVESLAGNPIAAALPELERLALCELDSIELTIPRAARWMADVAGRLLAILEVRLEKRLPAEAVGSHLPFFANPNAARRNPLEKAFAAGRFDEVERQCARAEREAGLALSEWVLRAFAAVAAGNGAAAGRIIEAARGESPRSFDLHFIEGWQHARAGRTAKASWAFTRAACSVDTEIDSVAATLATKTGVTIRLSD